MKEYTPPATMSELIGQLSALERAPAAEQIRLALALIDGYKGVLSLMRRAAVVRMVLWYGHQTGADLSGISERTMNKTTSEARRFLQVALRYLGGGDDPRLLEPGAPFHPLSRSVLRASQGFPWDTLELTARSHTQRGVELARLIMQGDPVELPAPSAT